MTLYEELKARGLVAQITDEEIIDLINNGKATFYIGFDCTADSLTAGHFMALTLMKRLQMAGNKPIALIGGGTTMIGDPSGRTDMRKMLTKEDIAHNAACFKKQMEKFIDFSDGKALMLNNADWLLNLNYVELLRDVGACFSVNNMLRAKCYEQRMEKGLSFLEFNYMIMQSYDFYYMFQHYGCNMQFGGDDQWSNMLGGTELIRRKLGKDAYAMTITLLTDSQGKKMGKTAGNAVWLDPNKTSPFEFYQYWRNVGDADVMKCIRMLTFLPLEQIDEMSTWKDQRLNEAKEILAYELTSMVHGKEEAEKAQNAARALFSGNAMDTEHMPSTQLTEADLTDGSIGILTLMVKAGLAASNGEARRLVVQGGVLIDDKGSAAGSAGGFQQGRRPVGAPDGRIAPGHGMLRGVERHHLADIVDGIQRVWRWGDVERGRIFGPVRRGNGVDEGIRRADFIRPDAAVQGIGVVPLCVDRQCAVQPLNGGQTGDVDVYAVHIGDGGGDAGRQNVIGHDVTGSATASTGDGVNVIFKHVQGVAGQGGDAGCRVEQEQILTRREIHGQLPGGSPQQRRSQPAFFIPVLLVGLGRGIEFVDVKVEH